MRERLHIKLLAAAASHLWEAVAEQRKKRLQRGLSHGWCIVLQECCNHGRAALELDNVLATAQLRLHKLEQRDGKRRVARLGATNGVEHVEGTTREKQVERLEGRNHHAVTAGAFRE